jgi:hypothetical protein
MVHKFKKGDRIRLVHDFVPGLSAMQNAWVVIAQLNKEHIYTVKKVVPYKPFIRIRLERGPCAGQTWTFRQDHFELAKKSNEDKIKERETKYATQV